MKGIEQMKKAVIMGAGPAGLTAGYQLKKNAVDCTLIDKGSQVGGISKTEDYKGYKFDTGGHRFFTKFDEVNNLWHEVLGEDFRKTPRLSRIYCKGKFFDYPLKPINAIINIGFVDAVRIVSSYFWIKIFPYKEEKTLEQWVSNRFGKWFYRIFLKAYPEKVWGSPCSEIESEFGAQRIQGVTLMAAVKNAIFKPKGNKIKSLIDEFDYPKYGAGMMYTEMKDKIEEMGGKVLIKSKVTKVNHKNNVIKSVEYVDEKGITHVEEGTDFISSIPITELINILSPKADKEVIEAASNLRYRSIVTVNLIINKKEIFPDNWIYIYPAEIKHGRVEDFKNWSADMVPDQNKSSLSLEFFCNEDDEIWNTPDEELFKLGAKEAEMLNFCKRSEIEDYIVLRIPKAYPVYRNNYKDYLNVIEKYLRKFKNLQLIGRYGLFKYNNMDHSVLTGMYSAENIEKGDYKLDTWNVNTEKEYLEEKNA